MTTTRIMAILAILSVCAAESESWIPAIVLLVSMTWLGLFVFANGEWV